jgi:hypothetical protein
MFAPHHEVVAAELLRVCKPEGAIGLVNWTREGLIGRLFKILDAYAPPRPPRASPPPLWGDEVHVRALFDGGSVEFSRGRHPFVFPTVEAYMTFFEERYAKERLQADGRWEQCRAEMRALYEELNWATDGTLHMESEYLVSVIRP